MPEDTSLICISEGLDSHPKCPHGPTLLFERTCMNDTEKFYACSAYRNRKQCPFYFKYDSKPTKQHLRTWEKIKKKVLPCYYHQKLYSNFNELLLKRPAERTYCHKCEKFIFISEEERHKDHEKSTNLTDYLMHHPTEILRPLEDTKKEAQYLFSKKTVENVANILLKLGAKHVLCIGTPRVHEYISENLQNEMSSLLLDIDGRFHNFFGPLNYCWYNLFNHHFFREEAEIVFQDFLTQSNGDNMFLLCDPPFGGRVEPISQTIRTISNLHKQWNNICNPNKQLHIMFFFPYFMEPIMQMKSNSPGISGGLKELKMTDYKVHYDNHSLFTKKRTKMQGTPVRIFTNISLNSFELPSSDGYKYCKRCQKWRAPENKHCKKCKQCTTKNGKTYKHCNICERCVKPNWLHCKKCNRCALEKHACGEFSKFTGRCNKCNLLGHGVRNCTNKDEEMSNSIEKKQTKKRNINGVDASKSAKRRKVSLNRKDTSEDTPIVSNRISKCTTSNIVQSLAFKRREKRFSHLTTGKLIKKKKSVSSLKK
ncbi:zinc finger CCHC domain-containing protein 4 [Orussus abietinus]|uniref:zinc finger CCHC domain-containing protein 4 n=1 Tax=Orussus abietinus TaxID=222816 RepID=UPI0006264E19|nr:zinc finger CCHC domain-containing protein 4 [Orussus abietinus]